jgi:hypothetical protein
MSLNFAIARSRRRNGWCEFSALLFARKAPIMLSREPDGAMPLAFMAKLPMVIGNGG